MPLTKFKVAAAASALTAAAVLSPAVIAEAKPDLVPNLPTTPMSQLFGSDPILGPITIPEDSPWWWLGNKPNTEASSSTVAPLADSGTTIIDFQPLALLPGFLQPIGRFFLQFIPQFSICFLGVGVKVGPYGRVTVRSGSC